MYTATRPSKASLRIATAESEFAGSGVSASSDGPARKRRRGMVGGFLGARALRSCWGCWVLVAGAEGDGGRESERALLRDMVVTPCQCGFSVDVQLSAPPRQNPLCGRGEDAWLVATV